MPKVVINKCCGRFSLSEEALKLFGINSSHYIDRADPRLVAAVELLGTERASGEMSKLKIVEVPDDVKWDIDDYDGIEHVVEIHRTWH